MDTDLRESERLEQILRDFHLEGALFGYDDGYAQNREAFPNRIPFIIRSRSPPAEEMLTALGGLPLAVQAFRSLGLPGSVKQHVVGKNGSGVTTRLPSWRASSC